MGLLSVRDSTAYRLLTDRGANVKTVRDTVANTVGTGSATKVGGSEMTPMTRKIIEESAFCANRLGESKIGSEHILSAILCENDCYANKLLRSLHISVADIKTELTKSLGNAGFGEGAVGNKKENAQIPGCPTLSKYGNDLCRAAAQGRIDPVIGRDRETERVICILSRRMKNNPCLIGEAGVGKTAVVEGLCHRIVSKNVPDNLADKIIVALDISSMVAGAKYRGEFEERMKNVMDEVSRNKRVILFIDEFHTIIGAGGAEGAVDAANIIKPALARGGMQVIGATTVEEYRKYIEKDAALERRFQSVNVGEPTRDEAVEILSGICEKYEKHHRLKISRGAIEAAVDLSIRYIPDRYLPDKAIDLMDEAASKLHIMGFMPTDEILAVENEAKKARESKETAIMDEDFERAAAFRDREKELYKRAEELRFENKSSAEPTLTREHIEETVTERCGIPVSRLEDEEARRLISLEDILRARVVGQEGAIVSVARAVRRQRAGLQDPTRPAGSFIFLGPTGVGKTALAKALAEGVFGRRESMIRLDMSEYMERHSVSKLIGAPPGYVGYGEGGHLTEKVRLEPYSVILFDEIEKAHPDVYNVLLQILDEGFLTDSNSRRVDFRNTVIIMTSNVGARELTEKNPLGFVSGSGEGELAGQNIRKMLKGTFSPEFLNRIDEIILFRRLDGGDMEKIAEMMLSDVSKRIKRKGIEVSFSEEVAKAVSVTGNDPAYGARPIKRAVVRMVEDSFAEALLSGKIAQGDRIIAKMENGKVVYEKINKD